MRLLISPGSPAAGTSDLSDDDLRGLYAFPDGKPWVRANFVSTLDGSGTGPDGLTDTINTKPDHRVFMLNRGEADAIVVGSGTARAETYGKVAANARGKDVPIVLVSLSGNLASSVVEANPEPGAVILATGAKADGDTVMAAREQLGDDNVWVFDTPGVDPERMVARLADRGLNAILFEGGPTLFAVFLKAGIIDEAAITYTPMFVAGNHTRITHGPGVDVGASPTVLLEEDGTMLGLWNITK